MKKHSELTFQRVENFRKKLKNSYYSQYVPLRAKIHKTLEPVSYQEALKADYEDIVPGIKWGSNFECAWFQFDGKVPHSFKGKKVVAVVDVGGEACVFDRSGCPIQGLTNKRIEWTMTETIIKKRIYLYEQAQGGEVVHLMIDAGANNILGIENVLTYESMEDGYFNQASLAVFDQEGWQLYMDFDILTQLVEELPETSRHRKLVLYALNEVVNTYREGSPDDIAACRAILKKELDKPANASSLHVSAIGHAHIDIAWLWPLRETLRKTARTFSTALNLMSEYDDYKFGASQPALYQMMKAHYPALYERMKVAIQLKKWECQGAMWVEADCNLTSGESLVRQILYGKKFFQEEFDVEVKNLWLPDVFGYSAALPQLLVKSDVPYFMTQKISWNQFNEFPHHTFWWRGIDGTKIFSHFLAPNNYRSDCSVQDLMNLERKNFDVERSDHALFLYGAGDGGGGPSRMYVEKLIRAKDLEDVPKATMEFALDFFEKAYNSSRDLQIWEGELYLELHRGTLTTHALTKKMNRKLELLFREVEFLYSTIYVEAYPQQALEENWKLLLLNQFHDIIPGTSITRVHIESLAQYRQIESELLALLRDAEEQYTAQIQNDSQQAYLVQNSLSWERKDWVMIPDSIENVEDAEGNPLLSQEVFIGGTAKTLVEVIVPPMGHLVIRAAEEEKIKDAVSLKAEQKVLENNLIRVKFNDQGGITSIYDKEAKREVLSEGIEGNQFKLYEDRPIVWDAWDVDIYYEETTPTSPQLKRAVIVEDGPIRASIELDFESPKYSIHQVVSIFFGSKKIEFQNKVDWHEHDKMLRVEYPVNIKSKEATFEIQYGYVKRPTHYNTSWDLAQFEVVAHKWADISQPNYGIAILNDCKYGHKIKDGVISLNLLRAPKNPDPKADMHEHTFTYTLLPHEGTHLEGHVIQESYQLNVPLRAATLPVNTNQGSLPSNYASLRLDKENVIIEAVKKAEYSDDLIVRMYEAYGIDCTVTLEFGFEAKEVFLVNLIERHQQKLEVKEGKITLDFNTFEIHTVKVVRE